MHYIPRNVSVRPHQVNHNVKTFDALFGNYVHDFVRRYKSSPNFFILLFQRSDAFH